MPALLGNPPGVGRGPSGSGSIVGLKPIASVGTGSVPYGPTNGYANANGVTGFVGPAAGSLRKPLTWYVRAGGSNSNGGTSASLTPDRSGTGTVVINSGSTALAVSNGAFTSADVGSGICLNTGTPSATAHFKIVAVVDSTNVTVFPSSGLSLNSSSGWAIGGAFADFRAVIGDNNLANTMTGVQGGDTVYIGAGVYRNTHAFTPQANTFTSVFNGVLNVVGDVTGQYTGDAGMVQLTAYTTNDKTAPSSATLLNLNGKSNLAFSNIMFVGGNATILTATTLTSQNITFTDCAFRTGNVGTGAFLTATCGYQVPFGWRFDRCYFVGGSSTTQATWTLTTGAAGNDYDANVLYTNCQFLGSAGTKISVTNSGTLTFKGGGVRTRNCSAFPTGVFILTTAAQVSTAIPCTVYNSYLETVGSITLTAGTSGQIVEDYNLIVAGTPRSNVTAGTHSVADGSYAPLFHFGQERIWAHLLRRFGEPMASSPLLGFGNDGSQTSYDLANRPRPAGGGSGFPFPAVGALERGNTAAQASSPTPPQGTYEWQFTGPGFQDFLIPVNNTATTISISVQRDSAYSPPPGKGNPALLILANGTLGVTAQTIADTGASGGWNTLTAAAFTPSASGWVTVRIASYDGSGTSVASFADFTVA